MHLVMDIWIEILPLGGAETIWLLPAAHSGQAGQTHIYR